jgi:ribonuclease III
LEAGLDQAAAFIRRAWSDRVDRHDSAPKHPKSRLQEWAAANERKPPVYQLTSRTGPHHAPKFVVQVSINGIGEASAEGLSKQEAETAAAEALLEKLK